MCVRERGGVRARFMDVRVLTKISLGPFCLEKGACPPPLHFFERVVVVAVARSSKDLSLVANFVPDLMGEKEGGRGGGLRISLCDEQPEFPSLLSLPPLRLIFIS